MGINELVMESFTFSELEEKSLSNRSGKLFICETKHGCEMTFCFNESESYTLTSPKQLNLIESSEAVNADYHNSHGGYPKCGNVGSFKGGGAFTEGHGIDFIFETDLFPGTYELAEKSGFPGAKITVRRMS